MMWKIKEKLNKHSGESLAETLFALLFAALAFVMLAGAMTAAGDVVTRSKEKLKEYYSTIETRVVNMTDSGEPITITIKDTESEKINDRTFPAKLHVANEFSNKPVASYK